jgi:hypothetical protein
MYIYISSTITFSNGTVKLEGRDHHNSCIIKSSPNLLLSYSLQTSHLIHSQFQSRRNITRELTNMRSSTITTAASLLLKALATPLLITVPSTITVNTTPPVIAARQGKVQYGGVNIAGFDFGCSTWNGCNSAGANTNTPDMLNQIAHFTWEGLNALSIASRLGLPRYSA